MRILFVCMGNICRSPSAEEMIRHLLVAGGSDIEVESAGTHGYHLNQPPDWRAVQAARRRGIDLSSLRARQIQFADFERFDLILAMDRQNLATLHKLAPSMYRHRIRLLMEFAPELGLDEVPDPYYGDTKGFEEMLDLLEQVSVKLLEELERGMVGSGSERSTRPLG